MRLKQTTSDGLTARSEEGCNTGCCPSHPNVTAIVAPLFPGQQTGPSLVDILWGHISPSGKLPFTSTNPFSDYNIFPSINNQVLAVAKNKSDHPPNTISDERRITLQANFTEKLLTDHRRFDAHNITPRFGTWDMFILVI